MSKISKASKPSKANSKNGKQNITISKEVEFINNRIANEICHDTITQLNDDNLLGEYRECKSVNNEINILKNILDKYMDNDKKELIINEYLLKLIPAGTKGVIRGNKFNKIIKQEIENMQLDKERFEICFEKQCQTKITSEKPDWYILDKQTNKVIIGMNQLDLWGGGQQLNRGSKYLVNNQTNTADSKLLCVVCNEKKFTDSSKKTKPFKLFEVGFTNNTLCYIKNLKNIINNYFVITNGIANDSASNIINDITNIVI